MIAARPKSILEFVDVRMVKSSDAWMKIAQVRVPMLLLRAGEVRTVGMAAS